MRAVIALLVEPNADSPLNCDAGNLIRAGDMRGFNSLARCYTMEYARPIAGGSSVAGADIRDSCFYTDEGEQGGVGLGGSSR